MAKKQSAPDSETKASYFLKIPGKKKKKGAGRSLCNNCMARRVFRTRGRKKKGSRDSKVCEGGTRLLAREAEVSPGFAQGSKTK